MPKVRTKEERNARVRELLTRCRREDKYFFHNAVAEPGHASPPKGSMWKVVNPDQIRWKGQLSALLKLRFCGCGDDRILGSYDGNHCSVCGAEVKDSFVHWECPNYDPSLKFCPDCGVAAIPEAQKD